MAQYQASIDVSTLNGTDGFRMDGVGVHDASGHPVAGAGDINGDGFDDLVISAVYAPFPYDNGAAYVVFGGPAGGPATLALSALDGTDGFRMEGVNQEDLLGWSVASAGDVNGDGIDDLIVGAKGASGDVAHSGAAFVLFGTTQGFDAVMSPSDLDGTNGFVLKGAVDGDYAGASVASAGDVNGDGIDDLIVGAPDYGAAGGAYVVFGHTGGFDPAGVDLASLDGTDGFRIIGPGSFGVFGKSTASAGDVNGDGIDDVIVSTPDRDVSYVIFGKTSGFAATFDPASLDGTNGFALTGSPGFDYSGYPAVSAGDINGDGFDDLIIGAALSTDPDFHSGAAYVVFGKAGGFPASVDMTALNGVDGFIIGGQGTEDQLGISAASAGDVNGDGFDDLIVGTSGVGAYVVFGKAGGFAANFDLSTLDGTNGFRITGAGGDLGFSVASAGDLNGDGLDDLIVGADRAGNTAPYSGSTYVIYGHLPDTAVNRTGTAASQTLVGGDFADKLRGAQGDDVLWGNGGDDKLHGNKGGDVLNGGEGDDKLKADGGDDVLNGGAGHDVLTGGTGNDVFRFAAGDSTGAAPDLIRDFTSGQDLIDLHLIDADTGAGGDQAFHLVASFSGAAGELTTTRFGAYTLVGGDVDGDGTADFLLVLSGHHALTATDFAL